MSDAAMVRAEGASSVALGTIVGTGDVRGALATLERNVRDVIDVCRARGFVARYGDSDREFFGLPAWQLLGATYGLLPFVEWTHERKDGWEARAVVRTMEGADIGAAEASCSRNERGKKYMGDHDIRAMAQTRAMRNALRSVLGSALVLAGFDFADPDAPATKDQVKAIWTLAGKLGYDRDAAHERAGTESMKDLTREQAAELIDEWSAEAGADVGGGPAPVGPADAADEVPGGVADAAPPGDLRTIADRAAWEEAATFGITRAKALKFARELWPEAGITEARQLTLGQLLKIVEERG